ncbi:MAG: AMP-binding protein [Pseudomonadota bacterium]
MYDFQIEISQGILNQNQLETIKNTLTHHRGYSAWQILMHEVFPHINDFRVIEKCYQYIYPDWQTQPGIAWQADKDLMKQTHIYQAMQFNQCESYPAFHRFSVQHYEKFWQQAIASLQLKFQQPYSKICDLSSGTSQPSWLPGAKLNIAANCFNAPAAKTAIIYSGDDGKLQYYSYGELAKFVNRIAHGLVAQGFKPGDAIGIDMPMNYHACAIYLAIVKVGCQVVGIADSFAPQEIKTRLDIAQAKAIFTQDYFVRGGKAIPLYEKIIAAHAPLAIVYQIDTSKPLSRPEDINFSQFISNDESELTIFCDPETPTNILFSSGTTGVPKAIPWTHVTPIKAAVDAYYHQDIHPNDVLAWPTNLGWMMGPWLIYASLLNHATMALFAGNPNSRGLGEFIEKAGVTMFGVVPSLVKNWRNSRCMEEFNWSKIKCFASTAESSNICDMLYLMWLGKFKPIIEYCGGTEIGGCYITGTLLQSAAPATFTTPALGIDFVLLNENQQISANGEVALVPPSIGLSNTLLNRDHYSVYFKDMPEYQGKTLRRHGDHIEKINPEFYRALGRIDDTMNIGGIKISSIEIERVINQIAEIQESAAIAIYPSAGGPSKLVLFIVINDGDARKIKVKHGCKKIIQQQLNPLIKISDIVFIDKLPRTASNKIMRRILRQQYTVSL